MANQNTSHNKDSPVNPSVGAGTAGQANRKPASKVESKAKDKPSRSSSYDSKSVILAEVRRMIGESEDRNKKDFLVHQAETKQQLSALDRLNQYPTTSVLAAYIGTTILALVVFVIAMFQLVGDRWDNGLGVGSQMEKTNRAIEDINKKMDRLIDEDAKKK